MQNFIIIIALVLIVGSASYYLYKEKKKGRKCIGCPSGGCCNCHK